jgi:L-fuconolactonase
MIDAHQHFWRYHPIELDWMTDAMEVLRRDFTAVDLAELARTVGVTGTVAVQARRSIAETEGLLAIADAHALVLGVIGWADAEADDLEATVERFALHPRFVGLREVVHDMPSVDYLTSAVHRRLVASALEVDVAYDLLIRPEHLPAALGLVDAFPSVRFVVDHIGKPPRNASVSGPLEEVRRRWVTGMRTLAERPNVACKLSGLLTEGDWSSWRAEEVNPLLDVVLESFGASRCMVGSDWPVCTLAASYADNLGLVERYTARLSPAERDAVLAGTAQTWYRLSRREDGSR